MTDFQSMSPSIRRLWNRPGFAVRAFDIRCSRVYNRNVPTVCAFEGIRILMFYRDHQPPHFHVERAGESAEIGIDPISIMEGGLARSTRSKVFEWAAIHQAELRANWELARAGLPLLAIAPLD